MYQSLSSISCLVVVACFTCLGSAVERSFETKDMFNNDVRVNLAAVGCFKDAGADRALRNMYYSHRGSIVWENWPSEAERIILDCAKKAYDKGYTKAFAVQFYGECWSDGDAERRYSMHGLSSECINGVGKSWSNYVYRFTVEQRQSGVQSCTVNGKNYKIGELMEVPNDWSSSPYDAVCQKCECGSDGNPVDCSLQYFCDLGLGPLCARYKNVTDQCCPLCDCYNDGQVMPVGSSWPSKNDKGECSMCTCGSNGIASCTPRLKCATCYGDEQLNPGECCPKCVPKTTTTQGPQTIPPTTERPPPVLPQFVR